MTTPTVTPTQIEDAVTALVDVWTPSLEVERLIREVAAACNVNLTPVEVKEIGKRVGFRQDL